jgi:Tfp pilus assembly protein PilN
MNNHPRRVRINLASEPLRNRNAYYSLAGLLVVLILAASVSGGILFARYHSRRVEVRSSQNSLELAAESARAETAAFLSRGQEAMLKLKGQVDFANEIIFLKSLSWTKFLSELETSLPGGSYIVALAPNPVGRARVEVRLRAVFSSLNEELEFIKNLRANSFADIQLMGEEQQGGRVVSEVSLNYVENR